MSFGFKLGLLVSLGLMACSLNGRAEVKTKPGSVFKDCPKCAEMVVVPAGTFTMGSETIDDMRGGERRPEGPVHQVTFAKPFAVGKYPVTNAEFAAFIDATGYRPAAKCGVAMDNADDAPVDFRGPLFGNKPAPNAPVVCVNWKDARAYTLWLSGLTGKKYRLLSEAEWEYAAKGGSKTKWPWGDNDLDACKYENTFDLDSAAALPPGSKLSWQPTDCHDGHGMIAPVGSYPPNGFGLYDMIGNVWQWTEDCSFVLYPATPTDGSAIEAVGPCEKRAVRGSSWYTRQERHRPTFRGRDTEDTSSHQFGFRIARDL
jgi:formylglycine-generating enzyme required for sulfatase activity